jgi:hypothetical protein
MVNAKTSAIGNGYLQLFLWLSNYFEPIRRPLDTILILLLDGKTILEIIWRISLQGKKSWNCTHALNKDFLTTYK